MNDMMFTEEGIQCPIKCGSFIVTLIQSNHAVFTCGGESAQLFVVHDVKLNDKM